MTSARHPLREGVVLGLIAYVAVAVFYVSFDVLAARGAFHTVNVLGQAVFRGLRDPAILQLPVPHDYAAMAMYNGVHLLASLLIGISVARLAFLPDRHPGHVRTIRLVILAGFVVTILAVGLLSRPVRPVLPWWSIVMANLVAVCLSGWYLLRRFPDIWRRFFPATT